MSIFPRDGPSFSDESLFDSSASIHSLIDRFFSSTSSPWLTAFPFPFPSRSVPYSDLSLETEGSVATRFRSTELPEAYLFVADLPAGIGSDDVKLEINEGERAVEIGGGGGRFKCRFRVPEDGRVGAVSSSVENGVVTVVVPKVGVSGGGRWAVGEEPRRRRNVRSIEISGSDCMMAIVGVQRSGYAPSHVKNLFVYILEVEICSCVLEMFSLTVRIIMSGPAIWSCGTT
ncbi:hypothetical protein Droror1_Dr00004628 [Drosera rotundifolia]